MPASSTLPTRWSQIPVLNAFKFSIGRALWFFSSLSLFTVWHGFYHLRLVWPKLTLAAVTLTMGGGIKVDVSGADVVAARAIASFVLGGTLSFLVQKLIQEKSQWYLDTESTRRADAAATEESERLAELVYKRAGMKQIYASDPTLPVNRQPYAQDMRHFLATTRRLRVLSIAGYEFLGKGHGSLLYSILEDNPHIAAEVIVLVNDGSPAANKVIEARRQQLLKRAPEYTKDRFRQDITSTISSLTRLAKLRREQNAAEVKIYTISTHPIFRLVILDDWLFMSAYEDECHGHESAMFRFERVPEDEESERMSLYPAYNAYFEALLAGARRQPK